MEIIKPKKKDNYLTNGDTFGREITLGKFDNADNWYEVTEEEKEIMEKVKEKEISDIY